MGLGGSVEKLYYLPEAHTDFIMAVIAGDGLRGRLPRSLHLLLAY